MLTRIGIKKKGPHFSRCPRKGRKCPPGPPKSKCSTSFKGVEEFRLFRGKQTATKEGAREGEGEAKKHFLQKLISCRDHLASPRPLQGTLARPHLHSRLCPEPKLCSEKAPEGERKKMRFVLSRFERSHSLHCN